MVVKTETVADRQLWQEVGEQQPEVVEHIYGKLFEIAMNPYETAEAIVEDFRTLLLDLKNKLNSQDKLDGEDTAVLTEIELLLADPTKLRDECQQAYTDATQLRAPMTLQELLTESIT